MDRRAFVRGLATVATSGALAGCAADGEVPETAPSPPPEVREATPVADSGGDGDAEDDSRNDGGGADDDTVPLADPESADDVVLARQDSFPDDDGGLVVLVAVRNDGDTRTVVLVRVTVGTGSGEVVLERFVDLSPGESGTVRFTPDVAYDDYSGHVPEIVAETPATPLPSDTPSPTSSGTSSSTDGGTSE